MKNYFVALLSLMGILGSFIGGGQKVLAQTLLSQGRPTAASSTENSSYISDYAVDGISSTKWSSSSSGYQQWLYVDLGSTYDINQVAISWSDGRYATTFDIMTSPDALTWTTIRSIPSNTSSGANVLAGLYGNARYVKFNGRGRANPSGYRINEFKVYGTVPTTPAQQTDINTLTGRLFQKYIAVPSVDRRSYVTSMSPDGHWATVGYTLTGNWPTQHCARLKWMSTAYSIPGNVSYHDTTMRGAIMRGMSYITRTRPKTQNWYDTVITAPQDYMIALVLMKTAINRDSLLYYSSYLIDNTDNPTTQAANMTDAAQPIIHKGCVEDRFPIANKGYTKMSGTLDVTTGNNEGVMIDNSLHQHNAQLYSGGYGQSMLDDLALYMRLAYQTQFASVFTTARQTTLSSSLLSGVQAISYKHSVDFGSAGRDISRSNGLVIFKSATLDTMKLNDPTNATNYDNWKTNIAGGSFSPAFLGNLYFWKSDFMTMHGSNYYLSAKVISTRTYGTESLNGENLKAFNLPMGATNIMVRDSQYYHIFPMWDWSKVPGTTAELNDAETAMDSTYTKGTNSFAGGVSHIDDGAIAYQHNYHGVQAKKAYFFMNDMMLCLGSGIIASKSNEIATTVNQTFLNGPVTINTASSTYTMPSDSTTANNINWIQHDNVGYLFLKGGNMSITTKARTGNWHLINNGGSTADTTKNIFTVWFKHTATPPAPGRTYCYLVVPNKSAADMPALATSHGFVIDTNTAAIQAIHNTVQSKWAVVFYAAGTITMKDGMLVSSDKPAIVFIKKYSTNYRITVGDPLFNQSTVTITINKHVTGSGTTYNSATGNTAISITLPSGDNTGSSFNAFYDIYTGSMAAMQNPGIATVADPATDQNKNISVYPNPASGIVNIKGLTHAADIDVYNLEGHKYKTVHGNSVDITELPDGVTYFLRIHTNGTIVTKQLIKK